MDSAFGRINLVCWLTAVILDWEPNLSFCSLPSAVNWTSNSVMNLNLKVIRTAACTAQRVDMKRSLFLIRINHSSEHQSRNTFTTALILCSIISAYWCGSSGSLIKALSYWAEGSELPPHHCYDALKAFCSWGTVWWHIHCIVCAHVLYVHVLDRKTFFSFAPLAFKSVIWLNVYCSLVWMYITTTFVFMDC